jgi:phosphopantetheine adenylyltransferase
VPDTLTAEKTVGGTFRRAAPGHGHLLDSTLQLVLAEKTFLTQKKFLTHL